MQAPTPCLNHLETLRIAPLSDVCVNVSVDGLIMIGSGSYPPHNKQ